MLNFISWVMALGTAISLFLADYPYLGFSWLLLWGWVQLRIWQDRRNREKIIAEIELYSRTAEQNWTEENVFVRDFAGNPIPAFPKETLGKSDCQSCKYFYGKDQIVCAIHPSGYETVSCIDAEPDYEENTRLA